MLEQTHLFLLTLSRTLYVAYTLLHIYLFINCVFLIESYIYNFSQKSNNNSPDDNHFHDKYAHT